MDEALRQTQPAVLHICSCHASARPAEPPVSWFWSRHANILQHVVFRAAQPTETGAGAGLDKAGVPSPAPLDRLSNSERARHKNVSWFLMAAERVETIAVHSLFITFTCSIVLFQYLEVLMCTFTHTVYSVTHKQMTSPHHLSSSALVVLVQVVHGRGLDLRGVDDDVCFTRQIV